MNELALFAGAGGGILGGLLLGWRTVCAVEIDKYCASVLLQRQNEGILPPFPVWDDVCTFDGQPWRGIVDVVSGGFPCQDISCAGKGAGITGKRSGLWFEMARIIHDVRPKFAFVENSPDLTVRGIDKVLGGLAEIGYDAQWCVLGANDIGAPHIRKRIWILAYANSKRCETRSKQIRWEARSNTYRSRAGADVAYPTGFGWEPWWISDAEKITGGGEFDRSGECEDVAYPDRPGCAQQRQSFFNEKKHLAAQCGSWWAAEPDVGRVAHGVAARVDRIAALGEGQVPAVAALAWSLLMENIEKENGNGKIYS
jgi:DNA (cytosine-5)-methyltransferase 1